MFLLVSTFSCAQKLDSVTNNGRIELTLNDLIPYWVDRTHTIAVPNSVTMKSLHLLTGPNGGGKSSILRAMVLLHCLAFVD